MGYSDVKEAARDITKLALNGSPYWRMGVTITVLVIGAAVIWGRYNYAYADDVERKIEQAVAPIRSDIAQMKEEQQRRALADLTDFIMAARRDQCDAARDGRNASAWTKRLAELSDQYYRLAGRSFDIPGCSEV
jgi:hypothetical protein